MNTVLIYDERQGDDGDDGDADDDNEARPGFLPEAIPTKIVVSGFSFFSVAACGLLKFAWPLAKGV